MRKKIPDLIIYINDLIRACIYCDSNHCWASVNTSNKVHLILFVRKKMFFHFIAAVTTHQGSDVPFSSGAQINSIAAAAKSGPLSDKPSAHTCRPIGGSVSRLSEVNAKVAPFWLEVLSDSAPQHSEWEKLFGCEEGAATRSYLVRSRCNDISGFTIEKGERAFDYFFPFLTRMHSSAAATQKRTAQRGVEIFWSMRDFHKMRSV
jgi:hypothetical protein